MIEATGEIICGRKKKELINRSTNTYNMKIWTDKPIYHPGESIYINLLAYDPWKNKFVVKTTGSTEYIISIEDPKGANIHKESRTIIRVKDSGSILSEVFKYELERESRGGIYKVHMEIKGTEISEFTPVSRVVRVREYIRIYPPPEHEHRDRARQGELLPPRLSICESIHEKNRRKEGEQGLCLILCVHRGGEGGEEDPHEHPGGGIFLIPCPHIRYPLREHKGRGRGIHRL